MKFTDKLKKKLTGTVGTLVKLKVSMLKNDAGNFGVGFNDYEDGCQFIFENGEYDGFSTEEQIKFLDILGQTKIVEVANYKFKNVIKVAGDFDGDVFTRSFIEANALNAKKEIEK